MDCPNCKAPGMVEREQEDSFQLGRRNPVTLKATAPILACEKCEFMMSDYRMEQARCLAISAYLHSKENPVDIPEPYLTAHAYSSRHVQQLEHEGKAACFYCLRFFNVDKIDNWIDSGYTALCPYCGIDAVLPETEAVTTEFLKAMQEHWFAAAKAL